MSKNLMKPYFDLVEDLLNNGRQILNERTGVICYYKTSIQLKFPGDQGFLANTRRKIGVTDPEDPNKTWIKGQVGEDLGFWNGCTSAREFDEKYGTKVWYANANKTQAWLDNPWRKGEDDNGLIYQFREHIDRVIAQDEVDRDFHIKMGYTVEMEGKDGRFTMVRSIMQYDELIHKLLTNPTDRRMIVTALNVGTFDKCSLPPCHHTYTFTWNPDNTLDIECAMRSWDVHLAFNIQLTHIFQLVICRLVGMNPGTLTLNATNAHLYSNALEAVREMLPRDDFEAPTLVLSDNIKPVTLDNYKGALERISPQDIWLENYQSHPAIKTDMVS